MNNIPEKLKSSFKALAEKDIEKGIVFLRENGITQIQSVKLLCSELGYRLAEADHLIINSDTWSDLKETNQSIRDAFWDAIEAYDAFEEEMIDDKLLTVINDLPKFQFYIKNKTTLKHDLAEILDFDIDSLDYSLESLKKIDLIFKAEELEEPFLLELIIPLSMYIGEMVIKQVPNTTWTFDEVYIAYGQYRTVPFIQREKHANILFVNQVFDSFTQKHGAYNFPSLIYNHSLESPFEVKKWDPFSRIGDSGHE